MPAGRPTELTEETITKANEYLENCESIDVHKPLPTIEGLALAIGISRETVYAWEKPYESPGKSDGEDSKVDVYASLRSQFSDIVNKLRLAQGQKLIQNSLVGRYNPTIAKLILSGKHGYVEKSEVDNNIKGDVQFVNNVPRPDSKSS